MVTYVERQVRSKCLGTRQLRGAMMKKKDGTGTEGDSL